MPIYLVLIFKLFTYYMCVNYLFCLAVDFTDERSKTDQEGTQTNPVEHFTINCFSDMPFIWFIIFYVLTKVSTNTTRNFMIV